MALTIKSNSGNSFDSLVLITAEVLMFAPKPANSMRLFPFEMQGVEGEELAFLLLLPLPWWQLAGGNPFFEIPFAGLPLQVLRRDFDGGTITKVFTSLQNEKQPWPHMEGGALCRRRIRFQVEGKKTIYYTNTNISAKPKSYYIHFYLET